MGLERWVSRQEHLLRLHWTGSSGLCTQTWLRTNTCNCSSRRLDALFWPLWICEHTRAHTHTLKVFKISRKSSKMALEDSLSSSWFLGGEADLRQSEKCKQQGQGILAASQDRRQSGNGSPTSPSFPPGVQQSYISFQRSPQGLVTLISCLMD